MLTDTLGTLPDFLRDLHRLTALVLKVYRKWEGPIWATDKTSVVHVQTPQAVAEKIAYVMANPTAVGAVRDAADWPGLISSPKEIGKGTWTAKRPSEYLDQESEQWPQEATFTLRLPASLEQAYSDPLAVIKNEYQELLKKARQELAANGRHFMGPDRVKKLSPYQRATSWEDIRGLNPTFAVGREQHEARAVAIKALKTFRQTYRAALELWRNGDRFVRFPAGTWWMTIFHGAPVADTG